ncbi:1,4-dihydroxy-2-naphthoyl-CoA synthase [compost metagenome]
MNAPPDVDGKDPIARGNRRYGDFLRRLCNAPKVVVASVRGAAMGGGAGLVCAADIAIGAQGAKFGFPEAAIGLVPGQILPFVAARIGAQAARRLMLTGERIDAAEAHRIGLLDYHVADPEQLTARTDELLARIVACAPGASAATKQMLHTVLGAKHWWSDELPGYLDEAADTFARQMRSEAVEGVAAARGKRAPNWQQAIVARD